MENSHFHKSINFHTLCGLSDLMTSFDSFSFVLLTDILSTYWHSRRLNTPGRQWQALLPLSLLISAKSNAFYWLMPIIPPSKRRLHLALMLREHFMSQALICQLTGVFWCWRTGAWKTKSRPWWMKRDRWVTHELECNTIMCFRYEYKTTLLTVHTRLYFISRCTQPPYFVFFVSFSSDYLHLIVTGCLHLKRLHLKMQVSIFDLPSRCIGRWARVFVRVNVETLTQWMITSHLKFQELWSSCAVVSIILNSVGSLAFTFKLYTTYNSFPLKYILLDLAVGSYVRWRNKLNLMTDRLSDLLDRKWHRREEFMAASFLCMTEGHHVYPSSGQDQTRQ